MWFHPFTHVKCKDLLSSSRLKAPLKVVPALLEGLDAKRMETEKINSKLIFTLKQILEKVHEFHVNTNISSSISDKRTKYSRGIRSKILNSAKLFWKKHGTRLEISDKVICCPSTFCSNWLLYYNTITIIFKELTSSSRNDGLGSYGGEVLNSELWQLRGFKSQL